MVKQQARMIGKRNGTGLLLVDGPPGIGCPVISAPSGADAAVVVSEPTASGVSDFRRIADLIAGFGIAGALLIIKWDINADMTSALEREARERGFECVGRIPYDEPLARAVAERIEAFGRLESPAPLAIAESFERVRDTS